MLQKIKNWLKSNIVSLGIIVGLLIYIGISDNTHHVSNETTKVDTALKPFYYYFDNHSDRHSQIPVQVITDKKEFRKATKEIRKEIPGTNTIESVTVIHEGIDTTFKNLPTKDTVNSKGDSVVRFGYKDDYNNVQAETNLNTKQGTLHLNISDELTYVSELEKHFFKRNEWKIDIKNKNKLNKIDKGMSFRQKEARPIATFAVFVGYDFLHQSPNILDHIVLAGGVGVPLFTLKSRK